jgi:hypothetical protein
VAPTRNPSAIFHMTHELLRYFSFTSLLPSSSRARTSNFDFNLNKELIQRIREFDECLVQLTLDLYPQ